MSFEQPYGSPRDERATAPQPGALPPYSVAPIQQQYPAPQANPAATASLVLGILGLVPGWLSALVPAYFVRSGFAAAQIGAVFLGISVLSGLIAIAAIICGHIGWSGSRNHEARPGGITAVIGLTLGYSRLTGIVISFLLGLLPAVLFR